MPTSLGDRYIKFIKQNTREFLKMNFAIFYTIVRAHLTTVGVP